MKNEDPFELTDDYITEVAKEMPEPADYSTILKVLTAEHEVRRKTIHDSNLEKWRGVYSFYIPAEVLIDMLRTVAWAAMDENFGYDVPLLTFHPTPPDTEDSYFQVLDNDGDLKDSLPDAIKKAYFRLRDDEKKARHERYLKLKEEFEPNASPNQN